MRYTRTKLASSSCLERSEVKLWLCFGFGFRGEFDACVDVVLLSEL